MKKTLDRGLELAETLTEKRTREYKARISKLNLKRLRLNRKCVVIEMNNKKWARGCKN